MSPKLCRNADIDPICTSEGCGEILFDVTELVHKAALVVDANGIVTEAKLFQFQPDEETPVMPKPLNLDDEEDDLDVRTPALDALLERQTETPQRQRESPIRSLFGSVAPRQEQPRTSIKRLINDQIKAATAVQPVSTRSSREIRRLTEEVEKLGSLLLWTDQEKTRILIFKVSADLVTESKISIDNTFKENVRLLTGHYCDTFTEVQSKLESFCMLPQEETITALSRLMQLLRHSDFHLLPEDHQTDRIRAYIRRILTPEAFKSFYLLWTKQDRPVDFTGLKNILMDLRQMGYGARVPEEFESLVNVVEGRDRSTRWKDYVERRFAEQDERIKELNKLTTTANANTSNQLAAIQETLALMMRTQQEQSSDNRQTWPKGQANRSDNSDWRNKSEQKGKADKKSSH